MTFYLNVGHVNGDTDTNAKKKTAKEALEFFKEFDHEGSTISLEIRFEVGDSGKCYAEEIYKVLKVLEEMEKE